MTNAHQRAFLELLEPVYDRLARYALAVTRDDMDADDLVSATVLAALEKFNADAPHENYLHFLIKIASRIHKRGRYRERNRVNFDERAAMMRPDTSPSPETSAELRIVMDALQTLPTKMRESLVLFEVSDLTLEEIREIQGGTLSGVKTRLKRGRERLARTLGVQSPESQIVSVPEAAPHSSANYFATQEGYV